ncbi:MAG: hypothetical protein HN396_10310 [Gemmatimonadales bacterium]|jgi:hypothetical protein|nr:hypothetical protein [Gemmatimonadales bacterium]MDG2239229.1 hypothetical protein [Longimicrobiales bacterium]NCG34356.1 hypothetical protein [Pseudomonadota bacterium]MBT3497469.1 hypothetical protein [Gemmatimonadales bacterium]MBT3775111.1 hypothetical protein [Gemmatimonadales bacterium]
MQSFEFVVVIVSIVAGLGIAQVLEVVARILRRELTPGLLHSLWMFLILLMLLQSLWSAWAYQVRADWSFSDLVVILTPRLFVFISAAVLNPAPGIAIPLDEYFLDIRRSMFAAMAGFFITASVAFNLLGPGPGVQDAVRMGCLLLIGVLSVSERRSTQIAGVLAMLVVLGSFTFSFSFSLTEMLSVG